MQKPTHSVGSEIPRPRTAASKRRLLPSPSPAADPSCVRLRARIGRHPCTRLVLCDRCPCFGSLFPPQAAVACAAIPVRVTGSVPSLWAAQKEKHLLPKKQVPCAYFSGSARTRNLPRSKNVPQERFCPPPQAADPSFSIPVRVTGSVPYPRDYTKRKAPAS